MADVSTLSPLRDLLARIEEHWQIQRPPVLDLARPGSPRDRTAALWSEIGLWAPSEVLTWFEWHDGADEAGSGYNTLFGAGAWWLTGVESQVRQCEMNRQVARTVASELGVSAQRLWRPQWLPLARNDAGAQLVVNGANDGAPLNPQGFHKGDSPLSMKATYRTLTEIVQVWVDLLDVGATAWDAEAHRWRFDMSAVPAEARQAGLL